MTIHRAGMGLVTAVAVVCSVPIWPETAQAQVDLVYKFPEGKKLTYKTTSRVRQVLTFGGTNMESTKRETKVWSRSVGKHRGDSSLPIEEKVHTLRVEYSLPPRTKLTLDSSDSDIKIADRQLASLGDVFKLESEITYTVVLDEQNRVKAVEGTEKLQEKAKKLDDPIAREEIHNEIGPDKIRLKFERALHNLPNVLARLGEPWERGEILDISGTTFTIRKKYEYLGTEKKGDKALDKISCKVMEVKYDQDPDGKLPLKVTKSDLKIESSEGTILFDHDEGHVVSASEKVRIKGNMTFTGAGLDQSGGFDLNFDANTQLQPPAK
jgi:hypothetical protein